MCVCVRERRARTPSRSESNRFAVWRRNECYGRGTDTECVKNREKETETEKENMFSNLNAEWHFWFVSFAISPMPWQNLICVQSDCSWIECSMETRYSDSVIFYDLMEISLLSLFLQGDCKQGHYGKCLTRRWRLSLHRKHRKVAVYVCEPEPKQ